MPSLAVTQPVYPRRFDLRDSTDPTDRQLESAFASLAIVQAAVAGLRRPNAAEGDKTAGNYSMPSTIPLTSMAAYKSAVDDILVECAETFALFAAIQALKPAPNQG